MKWIIGAAAWFVPMLYHAFMGNLAWTIAFGFGSICYLLIAIMDCDLEWKYTQEYITSLEARIAELEAALDKAAHEMYEETGSCPSDLYDWEHPNTCIRECVKYEKPDEAWKCWRLWLMRPAPPEEK